MTNSRVPRGRPRAERWLAGTLVVLGAIALSGCSLRAGDDDARALEAARAQVALLEATIADFESDAFAIVISKDRGPVVTTANPTVFRQNLCLTLDVRGEQLDSCRASLVADASAPEAKDREQFRDRVYDCFAKAVIGIAVPPCWSDE